MLGKRVTPQELALGTKVGQGGAVLSTPQAFSLVPRPQLALPWQPPSSSPRYRCAQALPNQVMPPEHGRARKPVPHTLMKP
jgi:hypothetical protein